MPHVLTVNEPQDMQTGLPTNPQWPIPTPLGFPWDEEEKKEEDLNIPNVNPLESQFPKGWDEDDAEEDEQGPTVNKPPTHFFGANNQESKESNMFTLNHFSDPLSTNTGPLDPTDILETLTLNQVEDGEQCREGCPTPCKECNQKNHCPRSLTRKRATTNQVDDRGNELLISPGFFD